ncbi:Integrase catalytic core [Penicillium freii]|nr:Integrase catalytic core [Penicillium freii]
MPRQPMSTRPSKARYGLCDDDGIAAAILYDLQKGDWGVPVVWISDRDKTFAEGIWKGLFTALRTKLLYTAAYHQSADGQSERSNQTAEIWLRHWQNLHQDVDWNEGLAPMHEHGLQSQFQQAIGQILCHVHWLPARNYERQRHEYDWPTSERRNQATAIHHRFYYKYTKSNRGIKSSARHPVSFRRPLRPWPNFITDIEHTHQRQVWGRSVIQVDLVSRRLNDEKSLLMKQGYMAELSRT